MGAFNVRQKTDTGETKNRNITKITRCPPVKCDRCDRLPPLFTLYLAKRRKKKESVRGISHIEE